VDDEDAKHSLLNIRRMVTEYLKSGDPIDARYMTAFEAIARITTEALLAKQQNRPMRVPP
jgi:hypothetical protein